MPHELGHNAGLHHDQENAPKTTAYAFSYGHRFGDDAYRTVMAYAPGVRLLFFSNPEVTYNGYPTGEDGANNAQVLKLTTPVLANYFQGNEEEDSNEDENSNPGNKEENPEEGSEKALTPATMDVEKEETKSRTTFTLSLRTENGDPVADRNIDIYQYKKGERTKLLGTVVTGADGTATYELKKSRKTRTLSFFREHLPEVVVKIAKSRSASRRKRN